MLTPHILKWGSKTFLQHASSSQVFPLFGCHHLQSTGATNQSLITTHHQVLPVWKDNSIISTRLYSCYIPIHCKTFSFYCFICRSTKNAVSSRSVERGFSSQSSRTIQPVLELSWCMTCVNCVDAFKQQGKYGILTFVSAKCCKSSTKEEAEHHGAAFPPFSAVLVTLQRVDVSPCLDVISKHTLCWAFFSGNSLLEWVRKEIFKMIANSQCFTAPKEMNSPSRVGRVISIRDQEWH